MGATKHISIRVSEELVKEMDAEAKRLERSRAWVISRRLENGRTLPPLFKGITYLTPLEKNRE
jgi:hypothetical protein